MDSGLCRRCGGDPGWAYLSTSPEGRICQPCYSAELTERAERGDREFREREARDPRVPVPPPAGRCAECGRIEPLVVGDLCVRCDHLMEPEEVPCDHE